MARFHGYIGFATTEEQPPNSGIFKQVITEREFVGEFMRNAQNVADGLSLNDNVVLSTRIAIVADPTAMNLSTIRYAKWDGVAWKVKAIEHQRPRLVLSLGEVYNGA